MDIQRKIIALLQGELRDKKQVAELMYLLATSPKEAEILLQQIDLSRRTTRLGRAIPSFAAVASRKLHSRIDQFEAEQPAPALFAVSTSPDSVDTATSSRFGSASILIGISLMVIAMMLGIGYLIGAHSVRLSNASQSNADSSAINAVNHSQALPNAGFNSLLYPLSDSTSILPNPGTPHSLNAVPQSTVPLIPDHLPLSFDRGIRLSGVASQKPPSVSERSSGSTTLVPSVSTLNLLTPQGGEQFSTGDVIPVVWSADKKNTQLSIEMSANGGMTWQQIVDATSDSRFLWTVPPDVKAGNEYLLRLRPFPSQQKNRLLKTIPANDEGISVDISPDGRYIATAGLDTAVTIWDIQADKLVAILTGHRGPIQSCRYNYDGSKIVTSALDGTAIIWDVATRKAEHVLDGHILNFVWWAAFSPDGQTVVTAHDDGTILFWDVRTGTKIFILKAHNEAVRFLEFTDDGTKVLAASTDRTASIIDVWTRTVLHRFTHHPKEEHNLNAIVNAIQLTKDGSTAITCGHDGLVNFWDVNSGKLLRSRIYHQGDEVTMIHLSPDGKVLISIGATGPATIIDPGTGAIIGYMSIASDAPVSPMIHMGFSSDPGVMAISHMSGEVTLWDIREDGVISAGYWAIKREDNDLK